MPHPSLLFVSIVVIIECVILLWFYVRVGRQHLRRGELLLDLAGVGFALYIVVSITHAQLVAGAPARREGDGDSPPLLTYQGALSERGSMAPPELYPSSTPVTLPSPTRPPLPTATLPPTTHVVQRGENLSFVAARYGTAEDAILLANDLTSSELALDQRLIIPPPGAVGWVPTPAPTDETALALLPSSATPKAQRPVHRVADGETLGAIAFQYGTSIEALIEANPDLDPDHLSIGQKLLIPSVFPSPVPIAVASVQPDPFDSEDGPLALLSPTPSRSTTTATRPPQPSPSPSMALPSATAPSTATVMASPFPTASVALPSATASSIATTTPFPSSTATSVATVTLLPSPTAVPATATVEVVEAIALAPRLLAPLFEQELVGLDSVVTLNWTWNYLLEADQTFEVQLWTDGQEPSARAWVSSSGWDLPPAYFNHSWNWRVVVVQGDRRDNRQEISLPSTVGRFHWR